MKTVLLGYLGLLCFRTILVQSACPPNCQANTDCDTEPDGGCPQCTEAYYGRQCQYPLECKYTIKGDEYLGLLNVTQSGRTCQAWDSDSPHVHGNHHRGFESNYCRGKGILESMPFCYTTDPNTRIEHCNVPLCEQQCKAPPQLPDLSLINPAQPGKGFFNGYIALFGCPNNVTVKSVCRSNTWSEVSCSDICEWNLHGKEQIALQLGEKVNISCTKGYHVNSTCLRANTLSESPDCKVISCGKPDFLTSFHDVIKINGSYNYQSILRISCIQGYESNTTTNYTLFTCNENEAWTGGKPFFCSVIKCNTPVLQNKSFVISPRSDYAFGDAINIYCKEGYELIGNTTLYCLANKSWSGSFPYCKAKDSVKCEICQFQTSSFGAGLATGVGSSIAVFSITFVIWYLAVRRKPDCSVSQTNASFANNNRNPYEDNTITKENEHIYLELNSTRIQPNTTYCNTDVQ